MNRTECIAGINLLRKSIPKIDIDVEIAYFMLSELPSDKFLKAIKDIVLDKNFKLYDNVMGEIFDRANNFGQISPEEAWEQVIKEISRVGYIGCPHFTEPRIGRAISNIGGWNKVCTSQQIDWEKKRFIDAYKEFKEVEQKEQRQGIAYEDKETIADKKFNNLIGGIGND